MIHRMSLCAPSPKPPYIDLVEEVASREGVSPLDLPPLYDAVDSDTFESLTSPEAGAVSLLFTYCGYDVTVDGAGHVTVAGGD